MGKRSTRVNELIKREVSALLHTHFRDDTVAITITAVDTSPDLRNGRVYYSVLGNEYQREEAARFFRRFGGEIRRRIGEVVILKYLPQLRFVFDESLERGSGIVDLLDQLDHDSD